MAYRKRKTGLKSYIKRKVRKYTKRRAKRSTRTTMVNRNPSVLIAPRYITKLKYAERYSFSAPGSNLAGVQVFNLNSIFDPDRTGVGHQPLGRDQLALLYNRYRVFAVSWQIAFQPSATAAGTLFVACNNDADPMGSYNFSQVKEHAHVYTKLMASNTPVKFRGRVSLPRLTGQTTAQYKAGLEYQALMSSDPTELMTLVVGGVPLVGSQTYYFDIQLTYHVECFDPKTLSQS